MTEVSNQGFILIVDDNPTNLSVLSEALASEGWNFRVAIDGESAIAQAQRNQPELILLDIQMPGIDGFETCHRLKSYPLTQSIPIIFTTALGDIESKIKGFSLGAVDYIPKPFAQAEVIARVRVHLQLKQLTDSLEQQVRDRTHALQQAQVQLVQQEKLSTLGELIAGIAHEMNNPISFITNNMPPLQEYIASITKLLLLYEKEYPNPPTKISKFIKDLDLDFVLEDLDKILNSLTVGSERIQHLSTSLRCFSRSDTDKKVLADLHLGLDSTLMILQHRLKGNGDRPTIEVIRNYGKLPQISCYVGEMNQVFMNILANAIDALDEAILQGKYRHQMPEIQITIEIDSQNMAVIKIADNGIGIPERVKQRLFEPLFTTKTVGKGTGLGLSIAHQIIVKKHNGILAVNSQIGIGTEFTITIPM